MLLQACNIVGDGAISLTVKPKDKDNPTDPTNVTVAANSTSLTVYVTYDASTDSGFSTHNLKLCTDSACSVACVGVTTDKTPNSYITSTADGTYFACVQGLDTVGKTSNWVSSTTSSIVNSTAFTDPSVTLDVGATYTTDKTVSAAYTNADTEICLQQDNNINNCS